MARKRKTFCEKKGRHTYPNGVDRCVHCGKPRSKFATHPFGLISTPFHYVRDGSELGDQPRVFVQGKDKHVPQGKDRLSFLLYRDTTRNEGRLAVAGAIYEGRDWSDPCGQPGCCGNPPLTPEQRAMADPGHEASGFTIEATEALR